MKAVRARLLAALLPLLASLPLAAQNDFAKNLAPYVPSPYAVVDRMLELAEVKPGETVYDLGCGDGRVLFSAIRKFKAQAVGVELSPVLYESTQREVRRQGLEDRIKVLHGHLLEVDLSGADVVTLYLLTDSNEKLKPNLEKYLKSGARVVSHDFQMRNWVPERVEKVEAANRLHTIYVYKMPPKKLEQQ